jgi:hypothetical protein
MVNGSSLLTGLLIILAILAILWLVGLGVNIG